MKSETNINEIPSINTIFSILSSDIPLDLHESI